MYDLERSRATVSVRSKQPPQESWERYLPASSCTTKHLKGNITLYDVVFLYKTTNNTDRLWLIKAKVGRFFIPADLFSKSHL